MIPFRKSARRRGRQRRILLHDQLRLRRRSRGYGCRWWCNRFRLRMQHAHRQQQDAHAYDNAQTSAPFRERHNVALLVVGIVTKNRSNAIRTDPDRNHRELSQDNRRRCHPVAAAKLRHVSARREAGDITPCGALSRRCSTSACLMSCQIVQCDNDRAMKYRAAP